MCYMVTLTLGCCAWQQPHGGMSAVFCLHTRHSWSCWHEHCMRSKSLLWLRVMATAAWNPLYMRTGMCCVVTPADLAWHFASQAYGTSCLAGQSAPTAHGLPAAPQNGKMPPTHQASKLSAAAQLQVDAALQKDAFLVFRALCKLSVRASETAAGTDMTAIRGKVSNTSSFLYAYTQQALSFCRA